MCGRAKLPDDVSEIKLDLKIDFDQIGDYQPRWNAAPTSKLPVVVSAAGSRILTLMRWGLIPSWAKDPKLKELGVWARAHADAGLEDWCLAPLTGVLGWSYEQVQVHIAKARQVLWDQRRHLWHEMRVVYGRKPR